MTACLATRVAFVLAACLLIASPAQAYLDPGTGSMLLSAVIGVAAAAVTVVSAFPPPLLVVPALVAIGATSAGGHVLDDGVPRYQLAVDVLHLAAASVWIGGLVSLALTASPASYCASARYSQR